MSSVLESYFPVADMIVNTFGPGCEAVIHDLTTPENSVVYVANGTVTGRSVGQSFDHLVRQVLLNRNFKNDSVSNYRFTLPDGRTVKSSSCLIRDAQGEVAGMLCVNCDLTAWQLMQKQVNSFLSTEETEEEQEEAVSGDVMEIIDELISRIIGDADTKNLSRRKCVELVGFMDEKGIFLVKGAIDKVAALMGVSKVTVYSYIDEAKGKR